MITVNETHITMTFQSLKGRTLSKIKQKIKAAISPGRSYNLAESDTCICGLLGSARYVRCPSCWGWNEDGRTENWRITSHHPRFPRKHSCHGNRCHWCHLPSWRRWSLVGTLSSTWSEGNNQKFNQHWLTMVYFNMLIIQLHFHFIKYSLRV